MTTAEIITIVLAFIFGYWMVSDKMNSSSKLKNEKARENQNAQDEFRAYSSTRDADSQNNKTAWFNVLEVTENASMDDITRAYKLKMSQYHPDKVAQLGVELQKLAELKSKEINVAYEQAVELRK